MREIPLPAISQRGRVLRLIQMEEKAQGGH